MPLLISNLKLSTRESAMILAAGSLASGLIQPAVAWLSDRLQTRWLGTLGLACAAICFGLLGHVHSFSQLMIVQVIGAAGVGAFHPVTAAAVGQLSARRSVGVAVFFLGGMIGGIIGNISSPFYVDAWGLPALVWLIVPGLAAAVWLGWAIHAVPHSHHRAREDHAALSQTERRWRWAGVWLLYAGNVLRFGVNAALVHLMIQWSRLYVSVVAEPGTTVESLATSATHLNGPLQAAMQVGMGAAGLSAGWLIRPGREKRALIMIPIWGALAIGGIAATNHYMVGAGSSRVLVVSLVALFTLMAGVGFGGVLPMTISLSQRLLPHRTGLASAMMMGGAWAVGSAGPPLADRLTGWIGLDGAFVIIAGLLFIAGLMALAIPGWVIRKAG
jgi:MFS family permease